MPHDAQGRLIEVGDTIRYQLWEDDHAWRIGVVSEVRPGSQACSGDFRWAVIGGTDRASFDAERAELLLKADGSLPPGQEDVPGEAA